MAKTAAEFAFLTEAEIQRFDAFFAHDEAPSDAMDASMLDGYLAAVVSGPKLIMPGEMLRWVWDTERGDDEPEFRSNKEAEDIIGLVMRQWNAVNDALTHVPDAYQPLLAWRDHQGQRIPIIDEWCTGYYRGIEIDLASWTSLLVGQPELFSGILTFGTADGDERRLVKPFSASEHQAIADSLAGNARAIHAFWLSQRREQMARGQLPSPVRRCEPVRRDGPKTGRNEPCPCGNGRKYKQCHGAN